ncbi:hydrogenase nickel incorporation protein HypB [Campylobacter sp. MIT 19-121]|uniref:hydrogenase nickel incorporation protein HypB n=1 Tax=Campylobacter sp. MIT 19-121 TaxID=2703906 RepID=UPI0013897645|nr:hydrogenase nickel incorporation protein HypB [Campylobacter sp. MIT 19-121]NDJ27873.1 hydrogenase nickel incorporation protein HypB [Campylobacter sp. MIT 19-121]
MCKDCGCSLTHEHTHEHTHKDGHSHTHSHKHSHDHAHPTLNESKSVEVITKILSQNDHEAGHNREHFNENKVLCLNLMSSPGSGKTTLLESTIKALKAELKISVIEGDLETENDAKRVREAGANAYQITTGQSCHLDAFMVHEALHHLNLADTDLLFIENVGNLVCPASYDLGQHINVVLLSVTEGSDKPAKYPVMFKKADLVIISKADLASLFDFDTDEAIKECKKLNPKVEIIALDAKNGTNLELWFKYLRLKKELN